MKPGASTRPSASMMRSARQPASSPTATILPLATATSARRRDTPVPSTTVARRNNSSASARWPALLFSMLTSLHCVAALAATLHACAPLQRDPRTSRPATTREAGPMQQSFHAKSRHPDHAAIVRHAAPLPGRPARRCASSSASSALSCKAVRAICSTIPAKCHCCRCARSRRTPACSRPRWCAWRSIWAMTAGKACGWSSSRPSVAVRSPMRNAHKGWCAKADPTACWKSCCRRSTATWSRPAPPTPRRWRRRPPSWLAPAPFTWPASAPATRSPSAFTICTVCSAIPCTWCAATPARWKWTCGP